MGFYDQTFTRLDELVNELDGASVDQTIDIYDELKKIRRNICRNPGTRKSYLVPRVTRALNKARDAIVAQKAAFVQEIYDVQKNDKVAVDDYMQMFHTTIVLVAIIAFYVIVLSTGRV
jgi:hypothetical protein